MTLGMYTRITKKVPSRASGAPILSQSGYEVILNPVFCGDHGDDEAQRALSAHRRGHNLLAVLQPKTRG